VNGDAEHWAPAIVTLDEEQFLEIDSWLTNFQSRMQDVQQKAARLTEGLAASSASKSSPDGAVTVTVGANGALLNLEFGRRVAEHAPPQLSALIMRTVRDAQRAASEKVGEALQEFGDDGAIMAQYANFQPPPPEDPPSGPAQNHPESGAFAQPPEPDPVTPPQPAAATPPPPPAPPAPPSPPAAPRRSRPGAGSDDDGDLAPW
jgi:DNA-binding protein YbaB